MRSAIIIGAGPAGLSAARALVEAGHDDVLVLDRNTTPGGLPLCCGHWGFGMLDQHRLLTGPAYAKRLVGKAQGAEIRCGVTVTALHPSGQVEVSSPAGIDFLSARAILLATGTREKPRGARLVSGTRPWGVITTGAFQDMAYRGAGPVPFRRPLIIGSELVAFSALLTARHAGVTPVAMLESGSEIVARWPVGLLARLLFRVPLLLDSRLVAIKGADKVTSVIVESHGRNHELNCDSVIFSGDFIPEAALVRASHLMLDEHTQGPAIATTWQCSDARYFAAGNILRPVEHSGWAAGEGRAAGRAIAALLKSPPDMSETAIAVLPAGALKYVYPQRVLPGADPVTLYGRLARRCDGWLSVEADGKEIWRRRVNSGLERRLTLKLPRADLAAAQALVVKAVPL